MSINLFQPLLLQVFFSAPFSHFSSWYSHYVYVGVHNDVPYIYVYF